MLWFTPPADWVHADNLAYAHALAAATLLSEDEDMRNSATGQAFFVSDEKCVLVWKGLLSGLRRCSHDSLPLTPAYFVGVVSGPTRSVHYI